MQARHVKQWLAAIDDNEEIICNLWTLEDLNRIGWVFALTEDEFAVVAKTYDRSDYIDRETMEMLGDIAQEIVDNRSTQNQTEKETN